MESDRFEEITGSLAATSRRGMVANLAGGLFAILPHALVNTELLAKKKGKRKKKRCNCNRKICGSNGCGGSCGTCTPPEVCQQGRCVCIPNCVNRTCGNDGCGGSCGECGVCHECQGGLCSNKLDDTPCNGTGKCLAGTCNPLPTCAVSPSICSFGFECCSNVCPGAISCAASQPGQPCIDDGNCAAGTCVGYRCRA